MHNEWGICRDYIQEFKEKNKKMKCPAGYERKKILPGWPGGNIIIFFSASPCAPHLLILYTLLANEPPLPSLHNSEGPNSLYRSKLSSPQHSPPFWIAKTTWKWRKWRKFETLAGSNFCGFKTFAGSNFCGLTFLQVQTFACWNFCGFKLFRVENFCGYNPSLLNGRKRYYWFDSQKNQTRWYERW